MIALIILAGVAGFFFLPQYFPQSQEATVRGAVAVVVILGITFVASVRFARQHREQVRQRRADEAARKVAEEAAAQAEKRRSIMADLAAYNAEIAAYNQAYTQRKARLAQLEGVVWQAAAEASVRVNFSSDADREATRAATREVVLAAIPPEELGLLRGSALPVVRYFVQHNPTLPPYPPLPVARAERPPSLEEGKKLGWIK